MENFKNILIMKIKFVSTQIDIIFVMKLSKIQKI